MLFPPGKGFMYSDAVQSIQGRIEMANTKEPESTFVITDEVTLVIRRMNTRANKPRLGQKRVNVVANETQWSYAIHIKGKKLPLFAGTDLYLDKSRGIYEAALMALWFHMPTTENEIPEWFDTEELQTPQFRWFLDTARKLRSSVDTAQLIGEIPGVYMVNEDGFETHFDGDGWPIAPVSVGSVSEGTQELIDAKMDNVTPDNETPVTYPNVVTSPFSG